MNSLDIFIKNKNLLMYDFVDPLTVNFVLVCDPTPAMNKMDGP